MFTIYISINFNSVVAAIFKNTNIPNKIKDDKWGFLKKGRDYHTHKCGNIKAVIMSRLIAPPAEAMSLPGA